MKSLRTTMTTAAIPLLLAALPINAAELSFNAPQTARAQESAQLLHQAAQALGEAAKNKHVANLWIFPTGAADTVFAQYDLSSNQESGASTQHLAVLKV